MKPIAHPIVVGEAGCVVRCPTDTVDGGGEVDVDGGYTVLPSIRRWRADIRSMPISAVPESTT